MSRPSAMIAINGNTFKEIVQKRRSLASLEELLDVKRQAINSWIIKNKIPPEKLEIIVRELNINEREKKTITEIEPSNILFRSNRNVKISSSTSDSILSVAEEYFRLRDCFNLGGQNISITFPQSDPMETADLIIKQLELNRWNLHFTQVVAALARLNISVLFHNFEVKEAQAVCVRKGSRNVIFINNNEMMEDVCWRIFHEVCHLFCGHKDPSTDDEKFCNKVATEIVTPMEFFTKNKKFFIENFSGAISSKQLLIIDDIKKKFSCSSFGIALRLKELGAISAPVFALSCKNWEQRKEAEGNKVLSIFPKKDNDIVKSWVKLLSDPNKEIYIQFQLLILNSLIMEYITLESAAALLEIDTADLESLVAQLKLSIGNRTMIS